MRWDFIQLVFTLIFFCSFVHSLDNSAKSLNSLVQDFAFKTLVKHRPHTGALYNAILPSNLSGMDLSVVRLRSRTLWNKGANFSYFRIPSRTMPMPHVRRLAIVYQNLGNWSSRYYGLPSYSLITSVVGFIVFDASNVSDSSIRNLSLNTMGQPISVQFPNFTFMEGMISGLKCVEFSDNGTVYLTELTKGGICHFENQGHFSVGVPVDRKQPQQQRLWYLWMVGFVLGLFGLVIVGYAGITSMRLLKTKKIQVMERQADEDLVLVSRWVGGSSKMPSAAVTRTQPVLESGAP
ncbi:DUF1191 domain-containing protein [Quillaja saponaria]|uniref:DUF1191 domain-containing protein n=1 Tax=Quillaja saponaria TaxID=32244 RepID=A0AAD7KTQ8_QUISA|nr:DUF1191 domain-containing protein [Quillaja saponaria]